MPTPTAKLPLLMRRAALLPLFCLSLSAQAQARFPQYAALSYQTGGATNQEVRFRVSKSYAVANNRYPEVGAVVDGGVLDFGDGTTAPIALTVTAVGKSDFSGEAALAHAYAAAGRYAAATTDCCQLPNLRNNAGQPLGVRTLVVAGAANDSPAATAPPVVELTPDQAAATYQVKASDPNGDALTYSVATAADLSGSGFANAPGLRVDSRTGLVSISTAGLAPVGPTSDPVLLNAVLKVSDGAASVLVNHLIRVAPASSTAPVFTLPAPGKNQLVKVVPGQAVSFTVQATDSDAGDVVSLQAITRPLTSVVKSVSSGRGSAAQSTFSWTPTASEAGTYVVTFEATDSRGMKSAAAVTLQVTAACDPAAGAPAAGPDQFTAAQNGSVQLSAAQLLANDTDPQGRALQVSRVGSPVNGTVSLSGGTCTFTPTPGFVGTASFTYQVLVNATTANSAFVASASTGHYYEYVAARGICWTAARDAAATRTYQGLQGYLATVTTAAEKDVLAGRFRGEYWFGAADDVVEGEWRWKTGPEAGQLFWQGGANGTAPGFAHWIPNQPDDFKNAARPAGEDYASFYGESGLWNDADECATNSSIDGYVIEYGGLEECTPLLYATGTVTITVSAGALATTGSAAADAATVLEAVPNPSAGQFRLRVTAAQEGPAQVDVYDLRGRRVKAVFAGRLAGGQARELPVEAAELAAGVYVVRLLSGGQVRHLRIAVQK